MENRSPQNKELIKIYREHFNSTDTSVIMSYEILMTKAYNLALQHAADSVRFANREEDEYDYDFPTISKESILKLTIK